jgi:hypothetical protein
MVEESKQANAIHQQMTSDLQHGMNFVNTAYNTFEVDENHTNDTREV